MQTRTLGALALTAALIAGLPTPAAADFWQDVTIQSADRIVRRAYQGVLRREPDPASRGFVDRVLRDHWSEADVARELRNSEEYRNRQ